jgi:two-component system nitrogen regulation sensor histidine kinase NtrY
MAFKHFRFQVIARMAGVAVAMAAFGYVVMKTSLIATAVLLGVLVVYQIWGLISFVERTNRQLTRFLEAIRHHDFSQSFRTLSLGSSFEDLSKAFSQVADDFRRARIETEVQYRYLQTLVEHIGVGVIAFQDNGNVELINHAAKRILGINYLLNIDRLGTLAQSFPAVLRGLDAGQRALVKVAVDYDTLQLAIHATKIRQSDQVLTLVSIQNIGSELAEQEMVAWQNLIRVLTHEIMNSVTPIASLADSVSDLISQELKSQQYQTRKAVSPELMSDLSGALTTIEKRSRGLLRFVEAYRNLTRIPKPEFRFIAVSELVGSVRRLLDSEISAKDIRLSIDIDPPDLQIAADADMIEQVLINLILNSIQALDKQAGGAITVRAHVGRGGKTLVEVIDNGPGIIEGSLDKVFIPFFTTKKGGTGIGLALSRQIMRLHNGNISVRSTPHVSTCFTLSL